MRARQAAASRPPRDARRGRRHSSRISADLRRVFRV